MRFFGSRKRDTQNLMDKLPAPPSSLLSSAVTKETTLVYTGGALCVTLQRAKSRYVEEEGEGTKLIWLKDQRLGLTFVEMREGGVAVKDVPGMRSDVSPGQELLGVGKVSVAGMNLQNVVDLLQNASSPCELNFSSPPSPIVVSEVLGPARLLGVRKGMVLRSANGSSMIGAKLSDVGALLHLACESAPIRLTFTPYEDVVRSHSSNPEQTSQITRTKLRNTLCIGAVVAAISL